MPRGPTLVVSRKNGGLGVRPDITGGEAMQGPGEGGFGMDDTGNDSNTQDRTTSGMVSCVSFLESTEE